MIETNTISINIGGLDECGFIIEYLIVKADGSQSNLSDDELHTMRLNIQHLLVTLGRTDIDPSIPENKRIELEDIISRGKTLLLTKE